jgi:hypothetical protein
MIVFQEYSYIDPRGEAWTVPKGTRVDGASIPKVFWSIIGGPWDGKYRNASVIHDYFCVKKERGWQNTHKVFYEGMKTSGVGEVTALTMYYAVYRFGPRWCETCAALTLVLPKFNQSEFEDMRRAIEKGDYSFDRIKATVDEKLPPRETGKW